MCQLCWWLWQFSYCLVYFSFRWKDFFTSYSVPFFGDREKKNDSSGVLFFFSTIVCVIAGWSCFLLFGFLVCLSKEKLVGLNQVMKKGDPFFLVLIDGDPQEYLVLMSQCQMFWGPFENLIWHMMGSDQMFLNFTLWTVNPNLQLGSMGEGGGCFKVLLLWYFDNKITCWKFENILDM